MHIVRRVFFCGLFGLLAGCESVMYYAQAAAGQFSLMSGRQSIEHLVEDPTTPSQLKSRLELVLELRTFAENELDLPVDTQYSQFVDLQRDFVVWNVFAADELSLEARTWCYPIAGCAAYRGYFSEDRAREYAGELASQGYDSYVGGVAAYSTLGWLNDPVLNTFVYRDEAQLADLLFHELAHQVLYVPGDTQFNESFATAVAREGVRRWMEQKHASEAYQLYLKGRAQQEEFVDLLTRYRQQLAALYNVDSSEREKRDGKQHLIEQLRGEFSDLQIVWDDTRAYSAWMAAPINNAKLNSVSLYYDLVPDFQKMLAEENFVLTQFYDRSRQFGETRK